MVEPVTEPLLAETDVVPTTMPVARPEEFIGATLGIDEVHVDDCVTSCVEPSLKVAIAVNCTLYPIVMDRSAGVTVIEDIFACPTVMVVEEETDAEVAVMVPVPCPELVAIP
jgi:hypothetical protein